MTFPQIIQGGMGVAISGWRLARSVSLQGQVGVVSGTALDIVMARQLQLGDEGGHIRRALEAFPDPAVSERMLDKYFIEGGKAPDEPFIAKVMGDHKRRQHLNELLVTSNFVEVYLAKEGHDGLVGVNFLNKIQWPIMASLYGAMLAGVDLVIVGAGIPVEIPGMIDRFCQHEAAELKYSVQNSSNGQEFKLSFDPRDILPGESPALARPYFFPIISSATLATMLIRRCEGKVDGFVVEGRTAGGHNAPPRGPKKFTPEGEPLYGPRDDIDLDAIGSHGLPFFLAGSYGSPGKLRQALDAGAAGIQVGTLFAFSEESGMRADIKHDVIRQCQSTAPSVFTDPVASPTGFPFKVLSIPETISEAPVYENRERVCDLGYLREAYMTEKGKIDWRCSSEPIDTYLRKGGKIEDTVGRKCVCNGLLSNIGMGQVRKDGTEELPLITCGDEVASICEILKPGATSYSALDVLTYLLSEVEVNQALKRTASFAD